MIKVTRKGVFSVVVVGLIVGWVVGGKRVNPPVEAALEWPDEVVEGLFRRACMDCHSYETRWPWYSRIAPLSFVIVGDVEEGRSHFNVSLDLWGDADEASHEIRSGEMPPSEYLLMHPSARLDTAEKEILTDGLVLMFGELDDEARRDRDAEDEAYAEEQAEAEKDGDGDGDDGDGDGDDGD